MAAHVRKGDLLRALNRYESLMKSHGEKDDRTAAAWFAYKELLRRRAAEKERGSKR